MEGAAATKPSRVEGVAALVAASVAPAAAVMRRLPVPVVVEADITEAATVATFAVEVTAAVAATAIVVALDGKQLRNCLIKASKSYLHRDELQEVLVSAPWHGTELFVVFWMARTRGRNRFVSR
jgi:hypothetical protein